MVRITTGEKGCLTVQCLLTCKDENCILSFVRGLLGTVHDNLQALLFNVVFGVSMSENIEPMLHYLKILHMEHYHGLKNSPGSKNKDYSQSCPSKEEIWPNTFAPLFLHTIC